ncbi:MAG: DUF411 domain-containing protein [Gammaproteobacteria bacterium]|nr:MAG: DUF411 domain-containing protein [Gammaproteobacteria bacterium]
MRLLTSIIALLLFASLGACAQESPPPAPAPLPPVIVYKSPSCGCCLAWADHMRSSGFPVEIHDVQDLSPIKAEAGVPAGLGSCHTARVAGYFLEGHVPADDVKQLLARKLRARGLIVPGMVPGSPGMEQGDERQPYDVLLLAEDGSTTVFAHHSD